jgi:hypothetical protein
MPSVLMNVAVARAAERLPVLKRLPLARLVILAEVAMLARDHFERLTPRERRRLMVLVKNAAGRPRSIGEKERRELEQLIAKIEPKLFASKAIERFSPIPSKRNRA